MIFFERVQKGPNGLERSGIAGSQPVPTPEWLGSNFHRPFQSSRIGHAQELSRQQARSSFTESRTVANAGKRAGEIVRGEIALIT